MYIREIRDPHIFQTLCQQLLIAEFSDAQEVDDSRGDRGIDLYVPSTKTLYAMYCPRKDSTEEETIRRKIKGDIDKAARLPHSEYDIENFVFITPAPLPEALRRQLVQYAEQKGFRSALHESEKHLIALLAKHPKLRDHFPALVIQEVERKIDELTAEIKLRFLPEDTEKLPDVAACLDRYRKYCRRHIAAGFLTTAKLMSNRTNASPGVSSSRVLRRATNTFSELTRRI